MPRLPRIHIPNCLYYITAKGNLGESIFLDEGDYKMYLELLKKYKQQYGFKLFSFALMPGSLNLLMELKEGETISMVMHDINSSYTKYFNGRYARKGHAFRERFKSVVVEKETYLLSLINYIHFVPVRSGLARDPREYVFSTCFSYTDYNDPTKQGELKKAAEGLIVDVSAEIAEALEFMARLMPDRRGFADFMAMVGREELDLLGKKLVSSGLLGSSEFVTAAREQIEKRKKAEEAAQRSVLVPMVSLSIAILLAGTVVGFIYYQRARNAEQPQVTIMVEEPATEPLANLDGTEWIVEFHPEAGNRLTYPTYDKIIFKNGTVFSKYLQSEGFLVSNYSLTAQEDGTLVWETMQKSPGEDMIFWRGEEKDGLMKGVFSRRSKDGTDRISFTSPGYYKVKE